MPSNDERSVTARLPKKLVERLEDARYHVSKRAGTKISTKQLIMEALERFLDHIEQKLEMPSPPKKP